VGGFSFAFRMISDLNSGRIKRKEWRIIMVVDLAESREKIDKIDKQIAALFQERMEVANDVANYKRSTGKKVYDPEREEQKITAIKKLANNEFNKTALEDLFRYIISISRKYQYMQLGEDVGESE
jgi:chorismate mutase/prephenate dehydratase